MWKMQDFVCPACGWAGEMLVKRSEIESTQCTATDDRDEVQCGAILEPRVGAPLGHSIVRGNSDYAERQGERLSKRSSEHFKKQGRDEAIERQRMQFKREGIVQ